MCSLIGKTVFLLLQRYLFLLSLCFSNRHLFLFKDSIPTANPRTLEMTGYDDHTVLTEKQKTEFVTKVTRY